MSQESQAPGTGALVEARGARWLVVEVIDHGECRSCRLVGAAASNLGVRRTLLAPFDRLQPAERAARPRLVGRRKWMLGLRALLSDDGGADHLRGVASAHIDLLDYQLEPALACARGTTRLLLADEVGLGKTIQAGLILADLHARAASDPCAGPLPGGTLRSVEARTARSFRPPGRLRRSRRDPAAGAILAHRRWSLGRVANRRGVGRLRQAAGGARRDGSDPLGPARRGRGPPVRGCARADRRGRGPRPPRQARRAADGDAALRRSGRVRRALRDRATGGRGADRDVPPDARRPRPSRPGMGRRAARARAPGKPVRARASHARASRALYVARLVGGARRRLVERRPSRR